MWHGFWVENGIISTFSMFSGCMQNIVHKPYSMWKYNVNGSFHSILFMQKKKTVLIIIIHSVPFRFLLNHSGSVVQYHCFVVFLAFPYKGKERSVATLSVLWKQNVNIIFSHTILYQTSRSWRLLRNVPDKNDCPYLNVLLSFGETSQLKAMDRLLPMYWGW